ncbi:uncharacterized protein LOC122618833 [Drosophila teissieri]|uniref:uncharacterized protein LOC122618833 n=1 Tax=Drosophila teissieri TaxID=7243 RepID=UPI001CB9EA0C|nr:uncharacterized protein LOC122618833 [Drosophila teissieri]
MPKKPQHLSLVASTAAGYGGGGGTTKPKYSLTLHNSKLATGGKHLRDGLQQRQHLKAVDGVPLPVDEVVGVHLKAQGSKAVAATGEASGSVTRLMGEIGGSNSGGGSGSGKDGAKCGNADNELGGGVANGVMRAPNNRLWYH